MSKVNKKENKTHRDPATKSAPVRKKQKPVSDNSKLKGLEKSFRSLVDLSDSPVFIVDKKSGEIKEANKTALEISGITRSKLLNKNFDELINRKKSVKKNSANGNISSKNLTSSIYSIKSEEIKINGDRYLLYKLSNKQVGKKIEPRYKMLLEFSSEAMFVWQNNRFVFVNEAFEKLFGYTIKEATSSKFDFMSTVDYEDRFKIIEALSRRTKFYTPRYEYTGLTKDGTKLNLAATWSEISWKGKTAFYGIIHDISAYKKTELALQREAIIFNNLYDSIIITDLDGNIINWNKAAEHMYGFTKEEVLGKDVSSIFTLESLKQINPQSLKAKIHKGQWKGELEFARKNGSKGISETIILPFKDGKGEIVAVLGINRDITERKKNERELEENRKQFQELTDLLPQTIFEIDTEGKIIFVNQASYSMFGYQQKDFNGNNVIYDYITPKDRGRAAANMLKVLKGEKSNETEYLAQKKDGSVFPVLVFSSPIIRDGATTGLRGILVDITDRKQNEEQLRKLSRVVEQSPSSIMITNLFGEIEYVNPRFTELTGYMLEEVRGKNPRVLKSGETPTRVYEDLWNTITAKKTWRGELHNKKKGGDLYWEYSSISPLFNSDGKISHFIAIQDDITEKKLIENELIRAKEKAEQSDKLKSEFLAQMSHEIRSPLNIIMSYNSLLKEELEQMLSQEQLMALTSIDSAGKRLLRTIDLILNMAALQSGYIDIKPEVININDILDGLVSDYELQASNKNIAISFSKQFHPALVTGDEYIITEIFENLLSNALKYTYQGKIDVEVYENAEQKICVDVRDTGIGISSEYLPHLFLPFSQEESGYSRRFEGNGLGLALVKKYVDLLNAKIRVESIKGTGTKFTVTFKKAKPA